MARTAAEIYEDCDKVDTLFILSCIVFCWIIIPALGLGYSGYSTRKNGIASFYPAILSIAVCSIQWWAIGYTLSYSDGNGFIGDFTYAFHRGVLSQPVGTIPAIIFSQFQLIFEATVCAIVVGGFCERGRLIAVVPFIFLWSTLIYNPLAHMVWAGNGFLAKLGVMDFAGGTPVHICSGASATAISVYLSWPVCRSRKSSVRTPGHLALHKPQNTLNQILAMVIIWSSWIAFEAGTALSLNFKAVYAVATTNLCAAAGSTTWALITYYETGEWSIDSFFMGAISGLVMITPGGGFFSLTSSLFLGAMSAFLGRQFLRIKFTETARKWRWVDNGDTFATHFCLGIVATISTGLFGLKEVAAYDGTEILGGVFFDGHVGQLGIQLLEAIIGITYSFTVSYLIMCLIDSVPGFEVLAVDADIMRGMDSLMAESLGDSHWADEVDYEPLQKRISLD